MRGLKIISSFEFPVSRFSFNMC